MHIGFESKQLMDGDQGQAWHWAGPFYLILVSDNCQNSGQWIELFQQWATSSLP